MVAIRRFPHTVPIGNGATIGFGRLHGRQLRVLRVLSHYRLLTNRGASVTVPAVSAPLKRLVTVAILLGWLAPSAFALGVGLHLTVEHHGPHGASHEHELADLARAATHGHHHDREAAPDHSHGATFDAPAGIHRPGLSAVAVVALPSSPAVTLAEGSRFDDWSRRGPPTPLFFAHCSLLL